MEPGILIGIFAVIFIVTGYYIWTRDILYGFVYLFLFIYTVFAQIGYAYFPALSEWIKAYFGPEIFYDVNIFVTLSFVSFFAAFYFLHKYVVRRPAYKVVQSHQRLSVIFYLLVLAHLIFMGWYFAENYDLIAYANASNEDFLIREGVTYIIFGIGFKLSVVINLILYFLLRVRVNGAPSINRYPMLALLIFEIILFFSISVKIGSRTDPLALTLAVVVLEMGLINRSPRNYFAWFKIAVVVAAVIYGLTVIESIRSHDAIEVDSLAERILFKDYYAPAHILIAAMALHYVDPWEVVVSNATNALILLNHPYLQTTVADIFNPGVSSRSASYAFYIFSEGYLAVGWFGFIYNGLVVFLGLSLWRRLANSDNHYYNFFMLSLVATQITNITRSQSAYFVKDIYTIFVPAMILFFLATGLRPWRGRAFQWDMLPIKPSSTISR